MNKNQMHHHVRTLGNLHIILGILGIVAGMILYGIISVGGIISGDAEAISITQIVGISIGGLLFLLSIPSIIGGWGILRYKYWAKVLLIVIGCLDLLNFPLGTLLGAYTIWVLLSNETSNLFETSSTS
ncbi:hypothetical protein [Fulvivirga imtechensis]|uniref:hypothetical protein n=1 Tax=Fulvivirga imtechensis TaxID=881893 RepID=UPI000688F5E0|nr:hypothetical protein [Fulvivirga imtechensis]